MVLSNTAVPVEFPYPLEDFGGSNEGKTYTFTRQDKVSVPSRGLGGF